jgi:4-hydroxymandelate oxidase
VPEDRIQDAKAATGALETVAEFAGPALATALVLGLGAGWAFALDALTFLVSAAFLLGVRPRERGEAEERRSVLHELREGWVEVRSRAWVWVTLVVFSLALLLCFAPYTTLGPTVAEEEFGSTGVYGVLAAAMGVGTMGGALLGFRLRPRHPMRVGMIAVVSRPSLTIGFALGLTLWVLVPLFVVAGMGLALFGVWWETALAERIPPSRLSRVSSYDWTMSLSLLPIGYLLAGPLGEALGESALLALGSVLATLALTAASSCARRGATPRGWTRCPRHPSASCRRPDGQTPATVSPDSVDLDAVLALGDFEPLARPRIAPEVHDYVAGGAWDELSLAENEAAWRRRTLRPRVLVDVSSVSTATTLLGRPVRMPVAIAPTAAHADLHPDGEPATVRAAAAAGVPMILSTFSSRSVEDVAAAAPEAVRWFQLYLQSDRGRSRALVERAAAAGYGALVVTVDSPVLGYRPRERRRAPIEPDRSPLDLPDEHGRFPVVPGGVTPRLTWDDLDAFRDWAPGLPLVLKGILRPDDARLAVDHGADAIVVSNHGARQLDRVAAPVDVLEEIAAAVDGGCEIWVDGGVRRGLDVVTALALGARGVLVGRPVLWALAAGGEAGVARALAILQEETELALALLGCPAVDDVARHHVGP